MKPELLLLVLFLNFFVSCESNNSKDVSNEICDCLKEQYVGAKNMKQAERIKIGESCLMDNLNRGVHELEISQGVSVNIDEIKKSKRLAELNNQTMISLKSNCLYFKVFTNDKLNQVRKEFDD